MTTRPLRATYRLQVRKEFPLAAARELVPYLARLGVSHLYLSPVLAARPGSAHGYDVIDPTRINPELGTEDDLRALADALHARDMGIILDIVPNHMAASDANPYWDNVLERGLESRYASWFDIDWAAPRAQKRVILPVLGDELEQVLERGELTLRIRDSGCRLAYFDRTFPLNPATLPKELQLAQLDPSARPAAEEWAGTMPGGTRPEGRARLRALLEAQSYRLVFWRRVADINYRRFFDVNDLVGVRMEEESVFEATHRLVLQWVREGLLDGLRVDHVDGLRDPAAYLAQLRLAVDGARAASGKGGSAQRCFLFVEKILSGDEQLPDDWPVDGTTGYDFMTDVEDVFLEPAGYSAIEAAYRGLRHNPSLSFRAVAHEGKRRALTGPLWADVMRVARLARAWRFSASVKEIADAIVEFIVHLDVYRTYVTEPGVVRDADRRVIEAALRGARGAEQVNADALQLVQDAFFAPPNAAEPARAELVARLQQTSSPATAKGVEDTALYVYVPLTARNEVGGEPDRSLDGAHERVHQRHAARAARWPASLLALDTHDTKRSGDVRARLDALTGMPDDWLRHVNRWRRLNKPHRTVVRGKLTPDTNAEYLYYQTLFGLWPAPRPERRADDLPARDWLERAAERLTAYMRKAAREAKTRTSWTEKDPDYEKALLAFVRATLMPADDAHFLPDLARLTARTADTGFGISLARLLIQCTAPGVPDIYQGSETWNFTLVDPDNRRPVDFASRADIVESLGDDDAVTRVIAEARLGDPRLKLALLHRLLVLRRQHPDLFHRGDYLPVRITGGAPGAVFAFLRQWQGQRLLSIARTKPAPPGSPVDARLIMPHEFTGQWTSVLTGRQTELVRAGAETGASVDELIGAGRPCELFCQGER